MGHTDRMKAVNVVGAGLAGCEIALTLAHRGHCVRLWEMKGQRRTPAQNSDDYAELVCSNSFRAASLDNAVGALKEEMRALHSPLMAIADRTVVPAGGAMAVDRTLFAGAVTEAIRSSDCIEVVEDELTDLSELKADALNVIATGPLTSDGLAEAILKTGGASEALYFYDAIAPIVAADSVDMNIAFAASRYDKGEGDDYLNCPMDEPQYRAFLEGLRQAEVVTPRAFEEPKYFEGCLPIEVLAGRGDDVLRFGCMKPVGLVDPRTGKQPFAVLQLRTENRHRTAFNLVGCQSRMKWGDQKEVFRRVPGLAQAEFLRMGSIHRNTYIDAPRWLDARFRWRVRPHIRFAGQITGVEGYVESMACGILVAWELLTDLEGHRLPPLPDTSALGALRRHVLEEGAGKTAGHVPSNIHWGLFPPLPGRHPKKRRRQLYGQRALEDLRGWVATVPEALSKGLDSSHVDGA